IIIDEASAFKSAKSKRFKALKKVIGETKRVVQLTGTPTSNGLLDLWPQMYLLDGGQRLGRTMFAYKSRFFTSDYMGYTWTPREGAEQLIHARLDDLCFSLTGEDYLSLPDKIINDVFVSLPNDAKKTYEQLEKDFILRLEESNIIASSAAVLTNKLGQCANGFIYDDTGTAKDIHNEKIKALQEIVDGANGAPVLVAYTYREDLNRILKEFDFAEALTPSSVPRWNAGDIPMLIVHPASAGHGLNLQAGGNICVWYGLPWSLELYQQFNARLHRQGQTKPVFIHRIITKNTVDESIIMGLDNKHVTQKQLIESLKLDIQKRVD
ncbi:MAG: DEAD/DEAH box helicase, partial [Chloroflexi bacterium]